MEQFNYKDECGVCGSTCIEACKKAGFGYRQTALVY